MTYGIETGIKVGGTVDQDGVAMTTASIKEIFESGFATHQTDAVMLKALEVLKAAATVDNLTIRDCQITGKTINT